jgi:hypothetical protein
MASLISWFEGAVVRGQCRGGCWDCGHCVGIVKGEVPWWWWVLCVYDAEALITNNARVRGIADDREYWMVSQSTHDGKLDRDSSCASDSEPTGEDTTLDKDDISFKGWFEDCSVQRETSHGSQEALQDDQESEDMSDWDVTLDESWNEYGFAESP